MEVDQNILSVVLKINNESYEIFSDIKVKSKGYELGFDIYNNYAAIREFRMRPINENNLETSFL